MFGDFDLPLNINELNKEFNKKIKDSYTNLLAIEKRVIEENNICLDDYVAK